MAMEVEELELDLDCESDHRWTACERTLIDKMEKYLDASESMRVEISELEHFLLAQEMEHF